MVVWLKPCESRSLPGALSKTSRSKGLEVFYCTQNPSDPSLQRCAGLRIPAQALGHARDAVTRAIHGARPPGQLRCSRWPLQSTHRASACPRPIPNSEVSALQEQRTTAEPARRATSWIGVRKTRTRRWWCRLSHARVAPCQGLKKRQTPSLACGGRLQKAPSEHGSHTGVR